MKFLTIARWSSVVPSVAEPELEGAASFLLLELHPYQNVSSFEF
jgi:hypothetical protein